MITLCLTPETVFIPQRPVYQLFKLKQDYAMIEILLEVAQVMITFLGMGGTKSKLEMGLQV